MPKKYKRSQYIKYNWVSDDPKLVEKATELARLFRLEKQPKRRNPRDFESAFKAILTSVDVFNAYAGIQLWIPTNKNLFEGKTKRNPTYTSEIKDSINWLISNNYLRKVKGRTRPLKKNSKGRWWTPYAYVLGNRWLAEIAGATLSDPLLVYRNPITYIEVRVKDDKGNKVAIELTDSQKDKYKDLISETNQALEAHDDLMRTVKISLGTTVISSALTSLTRVFTRCSLEKLGRFYCPLQNYTGDTRKHLRFNDDPTIEIDYNSIHAHMAYHRKGLNYAGNDPYILPDVDRDTVKTAFNIMINRGSSKSAAQTLSYELDIDTEVAKQLEQAIITEHSPIAEIFNSDAGLELQRLDSDIALVVLNSFIAKKLPIIPIHDSFVVSVRHTEDLILTMVDAYSDIVTKQSESISMSDIDTGQIKPTTVRGIKGDSLQFSTELTNAIERCFRHETNGMDKLYWDELIANESVPMLIEIEVEEVDLDNAI